MLALVAGTPLSGLRVPPPATVVIVPEASTFRIRPQPSAI
jgi:hypothetical protein